ncbi:cytoplasmic dynein 2 heavy chain 1 [Pelomyxa schiedti]|nr:cytoplasmic dynein 2 heavy chain 1 [Pelomyxa schiedti]
MKSAEGERVTLLQPIEVTENVELWLFTLSQQMKVTLKELLLQVLSGFDLRTCPLKYIPSQIIGLANCIMFTRQCHNAMSGQKGNRITFPVLMAELDQLLQKYTLEDTVKNRLEGLKIKAIILDIIHHRDVVEQLQTAKSVSLTHWVWLKQLRYYLEERNCVVCMGEGSFDYTWEYQGNPQKLVYTPLTDKCYLTLTQGIMRGFGGNPYGPAGTGKTESVKALGQTLGRQVVVFNCSEGIDYKSMGRMFTGLVRCGAWGCFDEFNRLDLVVLSAVSQQIQVIQSALKSRLPKVQLLENLIDVDPSAGIFVTMNPAGAKYGGRSILPDNLKQLFRPVAMSTPDLSLIAEVILLSEGFSFGKVLGSKVVTLFNLATQLLSPQHHYDWGLRALKSILTTAGLTIQAIKKAEKEKKIPKDDAPFVVGRDMEERVLLHALKSTINSKLIARDVETFHFLVRDVFLSGGDNLEPEGGELGHFTANVRKHLKAANLMENPKQIAKIQQLWENLNSRMGVVIVGPSGTGKTTLWKILRLAWQETWNTTIKITTLNAKAMPPSAVVGLLHPDTREWHDGVLTAAARMVSKESNDVRNIILCDSDIDPLWIESLNSVLDDNRHCLTHYIPFLSHVSPGY